MNECLFLAPETMMRALELLHTLRAIDDDCQLTKIGDSMAAFPLEPEMSKTIIAAVQYRCTNEILSICAMLSGESLFAPSLKRTFREEVLEQFSSSKTGQREDEGRQKRMIPIWQSHANAEFPG